MIAYLDIDGVLADWTGGVHRALGVQYDYHQWPYRKGPEGWNWHDEIGYSFDAVSRLCTFDFWRDLRWTEDGQDILRVVLEFVPQENIRLLTTPMPNVMSASGKVAWVRKNLPDYETQMLLICPGHKANTGLPLVPDSMLIDDGQHNVDNWRKAGGRAVLVPRWWNEYHGAAMTARFCVQQQLETLCAS